MLPQCFVRTGTLVAAAAALVGSPSVVGADSASPSASGLVPELHVQTGLSTASPHMSGTTAGGTVILQMGRRLAFEGGGAYLNRGEGASALSLSAGVILNLLSTEEKAVPYIVGGAGLLRASFDTQNPRFSGAARSGEMGAGRYRHVMDGAPPGWDLGELPPFYGERVQTLIARNGRTGRASFTDPAVTLGTGVRIRLGRGWLAGPDARALLIMRSGSVYTLWMVTIHLGRAF